jgi:hypothetical protein
MTLADTTGLFDTVRPQDASAGNILERRAFK